MVKSQREHDLKCQRGLSSGFWELELNLVPFKKEVTQPCSIAQEERHRQRSDLEESRLIY